ncbi:zinc ribbon domain-containing protein [Methanobrevibacter millerae]|uniref:Double zinc ribbon n=1 Tax=Methanobrevibacter millerae TaxID=230361 RepID=A0A1G5X4Y9_9EURY|nr:zinc ribbon domain-containing protein [Methanobrevibacter millerae]SDA65006.1 Double zinc ribbon [Methanobrevibacter millerae]
MAFEQELMMLEGQIERAQDMDELNYIRLTSEKKYWWTSIFVAGLFYALNGDVGKMIITWIISFFTLGIYALYIIYTSYRDQNEFNNKMEYWILQKSRELKGNPQRNSQASSSAERIGTCPNCGYELAESHKFCPNCGDKVEIKKNKISFCPNCGVKVEDNARFCMECGNKLYEDIQPVKEETVETTSEETSEIEASEVIMLPEKKMNSFFK